MPSTVKAYGVADKKADVKPLTIKRRDVGPDDVEINIEYCGVCHSDIHVARGDWLQGDAQGLYPVVTGHEIIGKVVKVGDNVKKYKAGDKVGVGCLVDSCRECDACKHDQEQYCAHQAQTFGTECKDFGGSTQGGYSEKIVAPQRFVVTIPDSIYGPAAAPLLCAGITTYSPLIRWGVKKGQKVGVAGYGGLGHMGVKIAAALGADVYILTTSESKAKDLSKVEGVKGAIVTTDKKELGKHAASFDLILNTIPVTHDVDPYCTLLKWEGKQALVGCLNALNINGVSLIMGGKVLAGSVIGGLKETQEMLDFCAKHDIVADIEMTDFAHINEAWERVVKNDVRFRFVIDNSSLNK